ncbi:MAG: phosphoadenylyl-sulfate reductase [Hydrogenophaga sp.]|nr:phosphoadenylyl-sulfate reductase [Hydrogenophaga sp.]
MSAITLYNRPSPTFDAKVAASIALLKQVATDHPALTQASSLGAEDMVVTHLISLAGVDTGIFVLDTGKLHAETLALIAKIERRYNRSVEVYRPKAEATIKFVKQHGEDAMFQSVDLRKQCCDIRKMEPLARALAGKGGWITGLRREQSGARADVPDVVLEPGRVKVNPLADWTWGDVWHFIATHALDYNELHDQFMPSIGCAPCTRAIAVGEDFRAGRWWWEDTTKECGLHVQALPENTNQGQPA